MASALVPEEVRRCFGYGDRSSESPLVALRGSGAKPPLFCMHPIGGTTVFCFDPLARALGPEQPVYGLQARLANPARNGHETIEAMAQRYLSAVRAARPEGPYHLCGWSLGGVVAFEMAQQLTRAGIAVGSLTLFDTYVPLAHSRFDRGSIIKMIADNAKMQGLSVSPEELCSLDIAEAQARLEKLVEEAGWLPEGRAEAYIGGLMATIEAQAVALQRYVPKPYPGSMTLLRALDDVDASHEPAFNWSPLCAGSFHVHPVPGTHATMIFPPHVGELAEVLGRVLQGNAVRAQGSPSLREGSAEHVIAKE